MIMGGGFWARQKVATVIVAADGSGDYTDIQSGIGALPTGGGVVYIKEGTYTLTTNISITSDNVALKGAGHATIIQYDSTVNPFIEVKDCDGVIIEDIAFIPSTGADSIRGIDLNNTDKTTVRGCWFEDILYINSSAILIKGDSVNCTVLNNYILNSLNGVYIYEGDQNIVLGNNILVTGFAVKVQDSNQVENMIVANIIEGGGSITDSGTGTEIAHNIES